MHETSLEQLPQQHSCLRVGFLGITSSGKSTIISVLAQDVVDDGKGAAITPLMDYPHQGQKISKIKKLNIEMMGFNE